MLLRAANLGVGTTSFSTPTQASQYLPDISGRTGRLSNPSGNPTLLLDTLAQDVGRGADRGSQTDSRGSELSSSMHHFLLGRGSWGQKSFPK